MSKCDLCWTEFPTAEERATHVEMEESIDWPVDGPTITEGRRPGCPNPSGRSPRPLYAPSTKADTI